MRLILILGYALVGLALLRFAVRLPAVRDELDEVMGPGGDPMMRGTHGLILLIVTAVWPLMLGLVIASWLLGKFLGWVVRR